MFISLSQPHCLEAGSVSGQEAWNAGLPPALSFPPRAWVSHALHTCDFFVDARDPSSGPYVQNKCSYLWSHFPNPTLKLLQVWLVLGDHVGEVWVTHEKANYCNSITTSWLLFFCWLRDWGCVVLNLFFCIQNTQPKRQRTVD